ncbi:MAG: hypothetical protein ACRC2T_20710 [Thermoguttaceae bacterium]
MNRISRLIFSASLFVVIVPFFAALSGCDNPQRDPAEYGKIMEDMPEVPEAKEPFKLPEVEGVDTEYIMRTRGR